MNITLVGHDRYFAVEQAALNYFPDRDGGEAVVRLSASGRLASAVIRYNGKTAAGRAWVGGKGAHLPAASPDNALRMAFYRAAKQLTQPPPWGALTGVRPAKKAIELLDGGRDVKKAMESVYGVSQTRAEMAADCAKSAVALRGRLAPEDIAVYVGIPFCPTRCAYCSFVSSSVRRDGKLLEPYLDTLCEEIKLAGESAARLGLRVRVLYWGGGTPAVLGAEQIVRLHNTLSESFSLKGLWEYTAEAGRPDAVTFEKLRALRECGVTRVSVNPQTLSRDVLDKIGRRHTPEQFFSAFESARLAGFETINTDLIAGLPGEDAFLCGLERVMALAPENITIHTLAKKRGAPLNAQKTFRDGGGGEQTVCEMLDGANVRLRGGGYAPYYLYRQKFTEGGFENTGWAKPGHECLYNLCMMEELCTVLSLGAGGVTKVVRRQTDGSLRIERLFHCKYPLEYMERHGTIKDAWAAFETLHRPGAAEKV